MESCDKLRPVPAVHERGLPRQESSHGCKLQNLEKRYINGQIYYYYDVEIQETNGVPVTLQSRQKCYQYLYNCNEYGCTDMKYDLGNSDWFRTTSLPAYGTLSTYGKPRYVYTICSNDIVTETFYGTDANGNAVTTYYQLPYSNK